jgi:Kef-type K+ transport system membrane component KefB
MALLVILIPMVSTRLKIPAIIGLLLAGMAVGPSGFGLVAKGAAMDLPATLGILYIMFLAGLEIDPVQIRKQGSHSVVFGLLTFLIPLLFGLVVGRLVTRLDWPSSILLASMFSSHTLLTYPVVSRLDLTRSRVSQTAVGGTIITDILAMLVLAVVAGYARGNLNQWFVLKLGLFVLFSVMMLTLIVPVLGRWFFRRASTDGLAEFAFVLGILFLFSWLAESLGLEKIIGAFLAGLALNRLIPGKSPLMGRIKFTGNALFIPLFLISTGMLIDLRHLLFTPSAWIVAGAMAIVILVSKILSSLATGALLRYDRTETGLLFGMTVNQAAATLAAVLVGYQLKLFGEEILSGTIFMILVSCIAGSLVTERAGRIMARAEGTRPHTYSRRPDRLAVAVAHPEGMIPLINLAILLRPSRSADPIFPIAIVSGLPDPETNVTAAEKLLAQGVVHAAASGIPAIPHIRVENSVETGILKGLTDTSASVLITGWSDNIPFYGSAWGPVVDRILAGSRQMVAVSRLKAPLNIMERVILILPPLVDRQEGFGQALSMVKSLTQQISGRMTVFFCENGSETLETLIDRVQPHVPIQFIPNQKWSALPEILQGQVRQNDLILLFSVRFGHYAWQPRLSRLPGTLIRNFPQNNFMVWFASGEIEGEVSVGGKDPLPEGLDDNDFSMKRNFILIPETVSPMGMVDQLMASGLPGLAPKNHAELRGLLIRLLLEESVELKEGIMLIHAHTAAVDRTRVLYAAKKGFSPLPGPEGMKALVILLGPAGQSPEQHLRNLSRLAQGVSAEEFNRVLPQ